MGKKRIVLDTNVLISALGWEGPSNKIFRKVLGEELELVTSYKQIEELGKVMEYPRFKFTEEQKSRFLTIIYEVAVVVGTRDCLNIIKADPDDNVILESAIENDVDFIITGDNHLLDLKEFRGVKILTPREFLDLI